MTMIRMAKESDTSSLCDLFLQLGYKTHHEKIKTMLREENKERCIVIAEIEKKVCGVIVINFIHPIHEEGKWCVISALIIDEYHRGKGIGHQLLAKAERIAINAGCTQIELASNERRIQAHKFYQNNGYSEVRKRFLKLIITP